jgi:hypothetical protein
MGSLRRLGKLSPVRNGRGRTASRPRRQVYSPVGQHSTISAATPRSMPGAGDLLPVCRPAAERGPVANSRNPRFYGDIGRADRRKGRSGS